MKCVIDGRVLTHEIVTEVESYTMNIINTVKSFNDLKWRQNETLH